MMGGNAEAAEPELDIVLTTDFSGPRAASLAHGFARLKQPMLSFAVNQQAAHSCRSSKTNQSHGRVCAHTPGRTQACQLC